MGAGVNNIIIDIMAKFGSMTKENAENFVKNMALTRQYQSDVFE